MKSTKKKALLLIFFHRDSVKVTLTVTILRTNAIIANSCERYFKTYERREFLERVTQEVLFSCEKKLLRLQTVQKLSSQFH